MKSISQSKLKELQRRHILFLQGGVQVDRDGDSVGYRPTKHHNLIEDRYADWVFKPKKEFKGRKNDRRDKAVTQRNA